MSLISYHKQLIEAYSLAMDSPDPSTQNGAIIYNSRGWIVGKGINKFPRGVKYKDERWERPLKYKFIEHAERNAIFDLINQKYDTAEMVDLTMVCPWAACADCARAIIQVGIRKLITHKQAHDRSPEFWQKEIDVAFTMFDEAGVEVVMYDGNLGAPHVLHSGQEWNP